MLLDLYSRLLCGKTVLEWAEEYSVFDIGIDVRRFVSFGIIKGFLRRVHRWPIFDRTIGQLAAMSGIEGLPESDSLLPIPNLIRPGSDPESIRGRPVFGRQESEATFTSGGPSSLGASVGLPTRRPDESVITLRSTGSTGSTGMGTLPMNTGVGLVKGRTSSIENAPKHPGWNNTLMLTSNNVFGSPPSTAMPPIQTSSRGFGSSTSGLSTSNATSGRQSSTGTTGGGSGFGARGRGGGGRGSIRSATGGSPGLAPPTAALPSGVGGTGKRHEVRLFYDTLGRMLDGQHHTDEIQVRFGVSWEKLEECLIELGGLGSVVGQQTGKDRQRQLTDEQRRRVSRGDYGRIKVVLR
jgi:nitrogen permease regulator 2-like protein